MPNVRRAPFDPATLRNLADYQKAGRFSPLTCPACGPAAVLTPAEDGLECPTCAFRQTTVLTWVADGAWRAY
jgi:ribosomal protein S27AE